MSKGCVAWGKGTRRVQLVRRDGRDVSTLYGRGGGGAAPPSSPAPAPAPASSRSLWPPCPLSTNSCPPSTSSRSLCPPYSSRGMHMAAGPSRGGAPPPAPAARAANHTDQSSWHATTSTPSPRRTCPSRAGVSRLLGGQCALSAVFRSALSAGTRLIRTSCTALSPATAAAATAAARLSVHSWACCRAATPAAQKWPAARRGPGGGRSCAWIGRWSAQRFCRQWSRHPRPVRGAARR